jgi:hypothetical protein
MVRPLRDVTVQRMRANAEATMADTCVRLAWTPGRDADDQEATEDWPAAETSICGYQPAGTTRESGTNVVIDTDRVRVPLAFAAILTSRDRLRVVTRSGLTIERGIEGDPQIGVTAAWVNLQGSST